MTATAYLGIDISKRTFDAALLTEDTRQQAHFSNDEAGFATLAAWLTAQQVEQVHACLEATGRYGLALAHWLFSAGHAVSVVNPKIIHAFAATTMTRTKTDAVDARLIAHYCQLHQPPRWSPPDPARDRLRQLRRYQTALTKERQRERNRRQAGSVDPFILRQIEAHLAYLDQQLADLKAEIEGHLAADPALRQVQDWIDSVPGLGAASAVAVLAELPDVRRFSHADQLIAYAGINPQQHQSGTSVRKRTTISKQGNAHLRTALFFPAMTAMRHCQLLQPFVQRLRTAGLPPKAIILAVMRKLLRWIYGVVKHECHFDPQHLQPAPA